MKEDHRQNFLDAVQSIAESVFDFHDRWSLLDNKKPAHLAIEERKELLLEEVYRGGCVDSSHQSLVLLLIK